MARRSVTVHVAPYPFWVTAVHTVKEQRRLKKSGDIPDDWEEMDDDAAYCMNGGNNPHIILGDDCNIYRLMHEVIHALTYMHKYLGIPLSHKNDEVLAYHTEFLVASIQQELKLDTNPGFLNHL